MSWSASARRASPSVAPRAELDASPGLAAERLDARDGAARARQMGALALDLDEELRLGRPREQRRACPATTMRAPLVTRLALARRQQLRRADARRERARKDGARRAPRTPPPARTAPPSPSGVASASTPSSAIACQSPDGKRSPAALTTARCTDRGTAARPRRGSPAARRRARGRGPLRPAPARSQPRRGDAPPRRRASRRSACRRMLNTCRSCSRVKPIAPGELVRIGEHQARRGGGVRGGRRGRLDRRVLRRGFVHEPAAALDGHGALRQPVLHGLERADRAAELAAALHVLECHLEAGRHRPDRLGRERERARGCAGALPSRGRATRPRSGDTREASHRQHEVRRDRRGVARRERDAPGLVARIDEQRARVRGEAHRSRSRPRARARSARAARPR